ncbi:uncharacterized protein GLRG_10876 [Colletotrichum graminicola M1.001]|uniref:Uncharacterized protein n=1 Tax=Colletotrichum graminicola (strain M1.001 / M2 / FGSC 10212) TaxID=645133 RepID=E3QXY3_COLGM|nr:uncharacterized protein GLRG_10876 [Colletotrichum graminicola M1.001]EFQ35721.1 hypothetical protein GLRG_10876 [Colletotrichum graminicola M1.001]
MFCKAILEEGAMAVLAAAKEIAEPKAHHTRAAVVGDLAVIHLTRHRSTENVDIYLGGTMLPSFLKRELPRFNRAFTVNHEVVNGVTYRSPSFKIIIPVDLINIDTQFDVQAPLLSKFRTSNLPWATRDDLILMKAIGASERECESGRYQDVNDT